MKVRYSYRFYPSDAQKVALAQLFGCVRVVWNDALSSVQGIKYPGYNALSKSLTSSKLNEDRTWLKDVSSVPLQQSLRNLDTAFKNFFKSRGKFRKPRFKKKTNDQSATFTNAAFQIKGDEVYLAKIGDLKPIWSRDLPSHPTSVTVVKDCADRYFLSFVVEIEPETFSAENQSVGVDLGIKTFATLSTGEKVEAPDYSKLDSKIRKLQKKLSRQQRGSKRFNLTRLRIARLHNKISDRRKDFLHKLSTRLMRKNESVVLEDLNVKGMVKNRRLSRTIAMQGWRIFRDFCAAKALKFGREFNIIDRWKPTSQICSTCSFRWGKLDLSVRSVRCMSCNTLHDRDVNAAVNIKHSSQGIGGIKNRTLRECETTSVANLCEV